MLQVSTSTTELSECLDEGIALGKRGAEPSVEQVRMLLLQGVFLTVVDVLVSQDLHQLCDSLPAVPGFV